MVRILRSDVLFEWLAKNYSVKLFFNTTNLYTSFWHQYWSDINIKMIVVIWTFLKSPDDHWYSNLKIWPVLTQLSSSIISKNKNAFLVSHHHIVCMLDQRIYDPDLVMVSAFVFPLSWKKWDIFWWALVSSLYTNPILVQWMISYVWTLSISKNRTTYNGHICFALVLATQDREHCIMILYILCAC